MWTTTSPYQSNRNQIPTNGRYESMNGRSRCCYSSVKCLTGA
ncbi:hypothetical protein COLSTE_00743 [Collinsella stercoris DSM 13279]|uniref:Uncharacterized protein n=1 Tax=Collinsella stercoris DSM 13279 TaxID=445975 RepID=B6G9K2_9ACTN|nr:hypothetical protein COLSTE_00743 [Collinsella stercoris DSM 13279]